MDNDRSHLDPRRALATPLFATALLVLALNDHVLKGAGLLPGWLTGKLSDFAGLIVAPVVLAVLLRTRRRVGFAICLAAAVFFLGALQVSPAFSNGWSAALEWFGLEPVF